MAESPITNAWGRARTLRPPAEHFLIYRGREGAAYNHHPQITSMGGRLYASWSNGLAHEDAPSQHMLMSVSEDGGESWSGASVVFGRRAGKLADAVVTAAGLRPCGAKLVAYCGVYEYTRFALTAYAAAAPDRPPPKGHGPPGQRWHRDTRTEVCVSEDAGKSWAAPRRIIERFVPNLSPAPTATGRLILPGNLWYPHTDDPAGAAGWEAAGLARLPEDYVDDPAGFHQGCRHRRDERDYCEGSFFQTDDGVLHMMLRTSEPRLAVAESRDDGRSWSEPALTGYTDCCCRHHFGRLADGRFFGLSCPEPRANRTPLVLAASDDGVAFDRHYVLGDAPHAGPRIPGRHKGGRYGYPFLHVAGETAWAVYSIEKEDIAVCRFPLSALR